MKKLLLTFAIIAFFTSCVDNNHVVLSKDEYNKLVDVSAAKYPKPFELINYDNFHQNNGVILGSDQHEYLIVNYQHTDTNIMHYVDCELCFGRKQQELEDLKRLITAKDSVR